MGGRWINRDAVEWVLYDADVGAEQFPVLLVIASHADVEGRGSHPARSLVALLSRRSVRKVERDLAELVKCGQLLPGDWRRVVHIRADRRPKVYDLPDKYRAWLDARGVTLSPRKSRRGVTAAPRTDATGRQERPNGASGTTERGVSMTPEEILKRIGKGARGDAQPSAASHTPPEEQPSASAPARAPVCRNCGNRTDSPYHRNVCKEAAA